MRTCPIEAQQCGGIGKGADDVGAAFDLLVQPFQRVRGPDLLPVRRRECGECEQVVAGFFKHLRNGRMRPFEHANDLPNCALTRLALPRGTNTVRMMEATIEPATLGTFAKDALRMK